MAETFPISCISCRRKKIKCNKLWPCDQCQRRYVHCEFPSTFRNIKINEDSLKLTKSQGTNQKDELETLRIKNNKLLQEKNYLADQNRKLMGEIEKQGNEPLIESNRKFLLSLLGEDLSKAKKSNVPISGETTEVGERFYGPQTSHYMMDKLRAYKEEKLEKDTGIKKKKTKPSSLQCEGVFIEKFNHYNSDLQKELNLIKKPLPFLLRVDPNTTDIEHDKKTKKLNIDTIKYLVKLFFKRWSHCSSFIDYNEINSFLDNFEAIKDDEWEHDDDLLLLYMILIISIHNLMPNEFYYLNFLCGTSMDEFEDVKRKLIYELIYSNFEKLRHNLIFESITTIQAYILCTTWYFIEQKFEECWSMMFHTCSIAYAIGLHVMSNYRLNGSPNDEEERDALRYKIWFALKHVSGQICSILGRPNPISIQVNLSVLKSTHNSSAIDITKRKTHILLKIGTSECLRLSNLMLIENFLMDFTMTDLLNLDRKFDEEIETLEWFLREEGSNLERRRDVEMVTHHPLTMERKELIMDLAILFINKAKLFEPFLTKFDQIKDTNLILQKLTDSIIKFLNYIIAFCDIFVSQNQGAAEYDIIISCKLFRHQFPFFNSFIYQGIIVIYTLLHYKADVFSDNMTKTDNEFLKSVEEKLKNVLFVDRKLIGDDKLSLKMWSTNTIYLINRALQQIRIIFERQHKPSQEVGFPYAHVPNASSVESTSEDFFGFHMNDPFWLTDPEKLPYFLTSPFGSSSSTNKVDSTSNIRPGKDSPYQKNFQGLGIPQQQDLMSYSSFFEPPIPVQNPLFPVNLSDRMENDPYYFVSSSELSNNTSAESENSIRKLKEPLKEENT